MSILAGIENLDINVKMRLTNARVKRFDQHREFADIWINHGILFGLKGPYIATGSPKPFFKSIVFLGQIRSKPYVT